MIRTMMVTFMISGALGSAWALDDLITSDLSFPHCTELIVPVLVYTMPGNDDLAAFGELLEQRQDIWFTESHYYPWEYTSMGVLVDLLQTHEGGTLSVTVRDHVGSSTWSSTVVVPGLGLRSDIERHVVAVHIPEHAIDAAFPASGIYEIEATSLPVGVDGPVCSRSASTSIIVERPS